MIVARTASCEWNECSQGLAGVRFVKRIAFYCLAAGQGHRWSRYTHYWRYVRRTCTSAGELLTLVIVLQDAPLDLKSKSKSGHFRSFVTDAKHPFLVPPGELTFFKRKNKIMVSRDFSTRGSLRDMIHRANPTDPFQDKYSRQGRPLPERKIALLGRQILEALSFLKACGLRCTHAHCGNIFMLSDDWCTLPSVPYDLAKWMH